MPFGGTFSRSLPFPNQGTDWINRRGLEVGRSPRVLGTGITYHAMARGNARGLIFLQEQDWETFGEILACVTQRYSWRCHAYCLMPNHFHLAVTTTGPDLADAMRDLIGSYARAFNRRYQRTGHLFSARYRTVTVEDDRQLLTLVRYISRNPVEAKLVESASEWATSSYPAMLGKAPCPEFLDPRLILAMFDDDPDRAGVQLRAFVEGEESAACIKSRTFSRSGQAEHPRPTIWQVLAAFGPRDGVEACLALGYRQAEVARELGVSESALSQRRRRRRRLETVTREMGKRSESMSSA